MERGGDSRRMSGRGPAQEVRRPKAASNAWPNSHHPKANAWKKRDEGGDTLIKRPMEAPTGKAKGRRAKGQLPNGALESRG